MATEIFVGKGKAKKTVELQRISLDKNRAEMLRNCIGWHYSVKRRHIFEKSRKAKEMKANEIYS